jgi:hypothetical protein
MPKVIEAQQLTSDNGRRLKRVLAEYTSCLRNRRDLPSARRDQADFALLRCHRSQTSGSSAMHSFVTSLVIPYREYFVVDVFG